MAMRDLSISVHFARAVLKNAVEQGLDPISLLRKNRISPRLLLEENARISIERFADLQVSVMLAMGDEALGYTSRRMPLGAWSMMCHAVIGCETLGQAIARYCRFYQLFDFGVHCVLEQDDDLAHIASNDKDPSVRREGLAALCKRRPRRMETIVGALGDVQDLPADVVIYPGIITGRTSPPSGAT